MEFLDTQQSNSGIMERKHLKMFKITMEVELQMG